MKKKTLPTNTTPLYVPSRLAMINWILFPVLLVVFVLIYAVGIAQHPRWDGSSTSAQVLTTQGPLAIPTVVPIRWTGEGLVTFWFDDAWLSEYQVGLVGLERRAWVGALAVTTDFVGYDAYMTWPQIVRTQYKGWEITPHSRTHKCDPDRLTAEGLRDEVLGSKQIIASRGLQSDHYVLPCGALSPEMIALIKENYLSMRTSEYGINPLPVTNPYYLKANALQITHTDTDVQAWLDDAKQQKGWLILMFHQIDVSGEKYSVTPDFYSKILDMVQESGLQVVLPSQALDVSKTYPSATPTLGTVAF